MSVPILAHLPQLSMAAACTGGQAAAAGEGGGGGPSVGLRAAAEPPIRVLQVMEATIGGTKRHLLDLIPGLLAEACSSAGQRHIHVEVACPLVRDEARGDTSFVSDLSQIGVTVHPVPMTRAIRPQQDAAALLTLAGLIRRGKYDIVHAHSAKAGAVARPAAWAAAAAAARPRPATVYTPHGFAFLLQDTQWRQSLFLAVERLGGRLTDVLIALSPSEADAAVAHGVVTRRRVRLIENGISLAGCAAPDGAELNAEPATSIRRELGWDDLPVVGTVGWLTAQKDPITFLRAAARVLRERPEALFVWCGGGELEGEARTLAGSLGIEGRVRFLGYRPDARRVLAAYDVFVLASRFEGLSYSPLDAMALAKPVVATNVIGTRDTVVDGVHGFLVPPGDDLALADQILALLARRELRMAMGRAGRRLVERRFRVEQMVARTAALYRELAAASATVPARAPRASSPC